MATIIVVLIVILGAVTGGVYYYYENMNNPTEIVTRVANQSERDYLSGMLITAEKVFRIFNEYFKNVTVEEKVRQYGANNVTSIINIKFSGVKASGIVNSGPYAIILQNSLSVVKDNFNPPSAKEGVVEEYMNSKGIRVSILRRGERGKLVLPPMLNVTGRFRPLRTAGGAEQRSGNPYEPIDMYAYVNNGKVVLYSSSTMSFINGGSSERKERKLLSALLGELQKVKSEIEKEQAEAINNLPVSFSN